MTWLKSFTPILVNHSREGLGRPRYSRDSILEMELLEFMEASISESKTMVLLIDFGFDKSCVFAV